MVQVSAIKQRTPEWHAARKTGIGGSDAPVVMGLSPWKTPYELFLEKTDAGYEPKPETEPMRWGKLLEPILRQEYERQTGRPIGGEPGLVRHPERDWMIASLDGDVPGRVVELKAPPWQVAGWGEPGTDQIPLPYLIQTHHYLVVTGRPIADVAVLLRAADFRIYTVEADAEIAERIIEAEAAFWALVQAGTPPEITTVEDATLRWGRAARPNSIVADAALLADIKRLRQTRIELEAINERERAETAAVLAAIADKGDTVIDGTGALLCTWKATKGSTYTVTKKPGRRFLLKGEE